MFIQGSHKIRQPSNETRQQLEILWKLATGEPLDIPEETYMNEEWIPTLEKAVGGFVETDEFEFD